MHIIQCDLCGTEATRSANPVNINMWPDEDGCSIDITFNGSAMMSRKMLICPACTRDNNLPARSTRMRDPDERDELLTKLVDFLFDEGYEHIKEIAQDCMED